MWWTLLAGLCRGGNEAPGSLKTYSSSSSVDATSSVYQTPTITHCLIFSVHEQHTTKRHDKESFIRVSIKVCYIFCKFKFQGAQRVDFKGLKRAIYNIHVFEIFSAAKEDTVFEFCTKTLYIKIAKNKFLQFSKLKFQRTQRVGFRGLKQGICDIHVFNISSEFY